MIWDMQSETVSLHRIRVQVDALRVQEQDAFALLGNPKVRMGIQFEALRLMSRTKADRERLTGKITDAEKNGRTEYRWSELLPPTDADEMSASLTVPQSSRDCAADKLNNVLTGLALKCGLLRTKTQLAESDLSEMEHLALQAVELVRQLTQKV